MKIREILTAKRPTLSFEVFPPKKEDAFSSVEDTALAIASLKPDFMSVTYGAGGGTSRYTAEIASRIQEKKKIPAIAHLTCVSSTRQQVHAVLKELQEKGIENVLALRGDIPEDGIVSTDYRYASELVAEIREVAPSLCIGAACYPEGHPEASSVREDIARLKEKVDAGVDFITTQLFFDNEHFYHFLYHLREAGVTVPVLAGVMPVTKTVQLRRAARMAGATPPKRFLTLLDRYGDNPAAMEQAGIIYASEQLVDLIANHVNGVHIYTMNRPDVAEKILSHIRVLL
ncbi:MAG: methylenetetrahydrofolate reductase [Lachnospiraceae bacterium]|nr:methylenetetrahydrofolate reductase [NAD(P)H] [Lachnospiraceae bacterium]